MAAVNVLNILYGEPQHEAMPLRIGSRSRNVDCATIKSRLLQASLVFAVDRPHMQVAVFKRPPLPSKTS